jgi:hypothetical protein
MGINKRILSIFKIALMVWGAISLLFVCLLVGTLGYLQTFGNHPRIDTATTHDVTFVLNWCGLGESRIQRLIHSYQSPRSFTGDYLDAYAIKINKVDLSELSQKSDNMGGQWHQWYRGDQMPPVVAAAIDYIAADLGSNEVSWFPKPEELRSEKIYVYPWTISFHEARATAAELIFVRPSDNMIFFMGSKT